MAPTIIYCAGGNRRFAEIALDAGFAYGARLPSTVYHPLFFADQNFHDPDRQAYMSALAEHKPVMATVLDWERDEQLPEVLEWAEEAAQYAQYVVLIPKVWGELHRLPRRIGGKDVVLGYSVPTKYGGTAVPVWEFAGWKIHLLGGAPQAQIRAYHHFASMADVVSVDGNYAQKMAVQYCQFWAPGNNICGQNRFWPRLREADGEKWGKDAPYEAFRRSCGSIMSEWQRIFADQLEFIA